jgi:hypothetical protein
MPDDDVTQSAAAIFAAAREAVEGLGEDASMTGAFVLAIAAERIDKLITAVERLADIVAAAAAK